MTKEIYLDASAYAVSACEQRLSYTIVDGLKEREFNVPFCFGQAVHKFRATLRRTAGDFNKALTDAISYYEPYIQFIPEKDFHKPELLMLACTLYYQQVFKSDIFQTLKSPIDGELLIEKRFAFPAEEMFPELKDVLHSIGLTIYLSGTMDDIGIFEAGNVVIMDGKTMTCPIFFAEKNLAGYALSTQLMFYKMIAEHLLKLKNVGAIIDAIILDKECKVKPAFVRSQQYQYSDIQMNHFKRGIYLELLNIINWHKGYMPLRNFTCCNNNITKSGGVGQCKFFPLCSTTDEAIYKYNLTKLFEVKPYNPLTFGE